MSVMVQIRNVPDDVHRQIRARAALAGMSVSAWLLNEARRSLERPPRSEVLARIAKRPAVRLRVSTAAAVRAERGSR